MTLTVRIRCPACNGQYFAFAREPQSYNDYIGAPCSACGRAITEPEVIKQVEAAASQALDDLLNGKTI